MLCLVFIDFEKGSRLKYAIWLAKYFQRSSVSTKEVKVLAGIPWRAYQRGMYQL